MPMREILLIEDMASQALFITRLLGLAFPDAAVRHERTLADGMRFATDEAPQIILCDLGLSDSAGTATIEQLRAAVPHIPIIAMTSGDRHGLECLMVGADDFLDKQDLDKPDPFSEHSHSRSRAGTGRRRRSISPSTTT